MQYKEWLDQWLEHYVRPTAKSKTYERYVQIVRGHMPRIGDCELEELTPLVLQRFVAELLKSGNLKTGKGLSANSVNGIVTLMRSSLKAAEEIGLVSRCAVAKIKRPKASEKQVSCFSPQEQRKIEQAVTACNNRRMFGVVLSLYTGLRIGELLALTWRDVDLRKGIISVTKTCHYAKSNGGKYGRITDTPKTSSSERLIPLPKQLIPMLVKLQKTSRSDYVVSSGSRPVSVRCYQHSFELLLKKEKIEHRGFHALRHTFATRALECGMDVKTLSEILGHKNPAVTLGRYVHSLIEHKRNMMNLVGRKFMSVVLF